MNTETPIEEAARVAAAWWGEAIAGGAPQNAGDGAINLAIALQRTDPATAEDRARFEAALRKALVEQLRKSGSVGLRVDYGPEWLLADVYCATFPDGRHGFSFPVKTTMDISPGDVTVRCGYRAPAERLLGQPFWRVLAYRPPMSANDSSEFWTVYSGADEQEARRIYATALSVLPEGGGTSERTWARGRCNVMITRDGSDASQG